MSLPSTPNTPQSMRGMLRDRLLKEREVITRYAGRHFQAIVEIGPAAFRALVEKGLETYPGDSQEVWGLALRNLVNHVLEDTKITSVNKVNVLSESISKLHRELSNTLAIHGGSISRQWGNHQLERRNELLRNAWPNMVAARMSPYSPRLKDCPVDEKMHRCIWPYINLEDLSHGDRLLLFLDSRARYHPEEFFHGDHLATMLGLGNFATPTNLFATSDLLFMGWFLSNYEMKSQLESMALDDTFGLGKRVLVLDIQEQILKFLLKCCHLIHDIPKVQDALAGSAQLEVPREITPLVPTNYDPISLQTLRTEAPYRSPLMIDLRHLHKLISAYHSDAEERFWSLRRDTDAFEKAIVGLMRHLSETDQDGRFSSERYMFVARKIPMDIYNHLVA
ncbi:hypothetical protein M426DRAFT_10968 [Hypoxylon sp. CI-4A]|nr:hypothetical protein M426DRAFT_10968 [Hypoxylon sp. CI-4A]